MGQGYVVPDFMFFLFAVLGSIILLFLLTYLALRMGRGVFHDMLKAQRHPYRFTLWLALGTLIGSTVAYTFLCYFEPSQLEILGFLIFFLFLLMSFLAITFGIRLWNLERKMSAKEHGCPEK